VRPKIKKRFEYLKTYLITPRKTSVTQEDLLIELMDLFEKNKKPIICANEKK
jgi:hypothetical protein